MSSEKTLSPEEILGIAADVALSTERETSATQVVADCVEVRIR
ncbi:hypothetical protein GCM10010451_68500 [Streptomyces virens]|uniref:Uncharacterized protein n=1 Tax=Streptomyces virens TaxID=285572 RepID=A0ABN3V2T9_9ACTN